MSLTTLPFLINQQTIVCLRIVDRRLCMQFHAEKTSSMAFKDVAKFFKTSQTETVLVFMRKCASNFI